MSEVNHSHYRNGQIQPIDYIESNDLGFSEGSVVKYITRWCFKNGAQDLCKAIHYTLLLLKEYFGLTPDVIEDIMSKLETFNDNTKLPIKYAKRSK